MSRENSRILALPTVPEFKLTKGEQWRVLHVGDSVFIANQRQRQDKMGKVTEIRAGEDECWVQVFPYSTRDDDDGDYFKLAHTELVRRAFPKWIESSKINDVMGPFFQEWCDADPCPPRINSKTWHLRLKRTPCKICRQPYLPVTDRQRYCGSCKAWIHVECMGEKSGVDFDPVDVVKPLDVDEVDEDGNPAIWNEVLSCPTVRGHHGHYDFENSWLITGSGTQKGWIEDWKAAGSFPDDWEVLFGERFLQDVLRKRFRPYYCPACRDEI